MSGSVYAARREVTSLKDCFFYHTMKLPEYGLVEGMIDLRESIGEYLGHVDFRDKRVLEIGPANGFISFHMEGQGADVVALDLSESELWDIVPFPGAELERRASDRRGGARLINNAFWLAHRLYDSKVKMVYGHACAIPEAIGPVDITTFGSVLLHVRDPFLALQGALRLTRDTVVVSEVYSLPGLRARMKNFGKRLSGSVMEFMPDPSKNAPFDTWWWITPRAVRRMIGALGFEESSVNYHVQTVSGTKFRCYTVVGHRTKGAPASAHSSPKLAPLRRHPAPAEPAPTVPTDEPAEPSDDSVPRVVPPEQRRFCDRPYRHFRVGSMGHGYICCPAWVTQAGRVGKIGPQRSVNEVWNGAEARAFRQSILDGTFEHCLAATCPVINYLPLAGEVNDPEMQDIIARGETHAPPPKLVSLNYDDSCNLSCPQCRVEKVMHTGDTLAHLKALQDIVVEQLEDPEELIITGGGDALASPVYRRFLHEFDNRRFPRTTFHLRSNGDILTQKMWDYIAASHGRIRTLNVSIDAARATTYELVRRGGNFERTIENMQAMAERMRAGQFDTLHVNFCVQKRNFREIPEFVDLAKSWSATVVLFQALHPAGELVGKAYQDNAVHLSGHPDHDELLEVLRDRRLQDPVVLMAGQLYALASGRVAVLAEDEAVPFDS